MFFFVCLLSLGTAYGEIHKLQYIYTALSKTVEAPGIFDFTAMGLLDDRQIDYYNSKKKEKIPRQPWMKENLPDDYWTKGSDSRKSKEQWFKVNVNILMERMRQNHSDVHVLQWMHGCEVNEKPDGKIEYQRGFDLYSYDGQDFLYFDDDQSQWVASVSAAFPTKKKWDESQTLNQYTKGYLERECKDWLTKFMGYSEKALKKYSPPKVFVFHKSVGSDKLLLTCMATDFYPKDVEVDIYRDGVEINKQVMSTGVRPSSVTSDGKEPTYQLRKSVEISVSDEAEYSCEVKHRSLEKPISLKWEGVDDPPIGAIVGVVIFIFVLVSAGVLFFLHRRGIIVIPCLPKPDQMKTNPDGSLDSVESNGSKATREEEKIFLPKAPDANSSGSSDSGKGSASNSSQTSGETNDLLSTAPDTNSSDRTSNSDLGSV